MRTDGSGPSKDRKLGNSLPTNTARGWAAKLPTLRKFGLAADDLLRNQLYRRLWLSILISSFGSQITMLAIPLTAAVLLHATPTQMGLLTAMELAPFVMFS